MRMILKFGGSSLADNQRIRSAAMRCIDFANEGHQVVVVVSAQGDTTDDMITKANLANTKASPREMDAYLSAGEQISAGLMAMTIEASGHSAVSLTGWQAGLMTDDCHENAHVVALGSDRILRELALGKIVVVAGFQGVNAIGDITTLGRGGSDTTAVALAAFLKADLCHIYTDVDGIYDKDPRKHKDANKYIKIGYDDMLQLARQGAQVLHTRCIELAQQYGVPIYVASSFRACPGTFVIDTYENSVQN